MVSILLQLLVKLLVAQNELMVTLMPLQKGLLDQDYFNQGSSQL